MMWKTVWDITSAKSAAKPLQKENSDLTESKWLKENNLWQP